MPTIQDLEAYKEKYNDLINKGQLQNWDDNSFDHFYSVVKTFPLYEVDDLVSNINESEKSEFINTDSIALASSQIESGDRAFRNNNPGALIYTDSLKKYGAVPETGNDFYNYNLPNDSKVYETFSKDDIPAGALNIKTYQTAKFPDFKSGKQAQIDLINRQWKKSGENVDSFLNLNQPQLSPDSPEYNSYKDAILTQSLKSVSSRIEGFESRLDDIAMGFDPEGVSEAGFEDYFGMSEDEWQSNMVVSSIKDKWEPTDAEPLILQEPTEKRYPVGPRTDEIVQAMKAEKIIYGRIKSLYPSIAEDIASMLASEDYDPKSLFFDDRAERKRKEEEAQAIAKSFSGTGYEGKSPEELLLDYELGVSTLARLRARFPDNLDYQRARSVNMKTGELIFPQYTESALIQMVRAHPQFQKYHHLTDAEISSRVIRNTKDFPVFKKLLITPDYMEDTDIYSTQWSNFLDGMVNLAEGSAVVGGDFFDAVVTGYDWATNKMFDTPRRDVSKEYYEDYGKKLNWLLDKPGNWANQIRKQQALEENYRMKHDPEYKDYALWVEDTPFWSNMFKDFKVWTRVISDGLPSLLTSFGSFGLAHKASKLAGLTPKQAFKNAGRASFATTALIEGDSELAGAVNYFSLDKETSKDEIYKDLSKWKAEFLEENYIVDEGTGKPTFPDIQGVVDSQTKNKVTHRDMMQMLNAYSDENYSFEGDRYWKKGLSVEDAVDLSIASALVYAPIAGVLERMQASRAFKMFGGNWGPKTLRGNSISSIAEKMEAKLRRIPGSGKFAKMRDTHFYKTLTMSGTEGMEEVAQYTSQSLINSGLPLTAYKPEFDFSWDEALESLAGGMVLGGGVGTVTGINKLAGTGDYYANKQNIKKAPERGIEYFTKKDDAGLWRLYVTIDGDITELTEDNIEEGVPTSYTSFRAANKRVRKFRNDQRKIERDNILRYYGEWKGAKIGESKFNKETNKYETEVLDKSGKRIDIFEEETSLSMKNTKRNIESILDIVENASEEEINVSTQEDIASPSVTFQDKKDAEESQETRKNGVLLKVLAEDELSSSEKSIFNEIRKEVDVQDTEAFKSVILTALKDEEAIKNKGYEKELLLERVREDYGESTANQVASMLNIRAAEEEIAEGPPEPVAPPEAPPEAPKAEKKQAPKKEALDWSKLSIAELKKKIKENEGKKDFQSPIIVKRAKMELEKRKGRPENQPPVKKESKADLEKRKSALKKEQSELVITETRGEPGVLPHISQARFPEDAGKNLVRALEIDKEIAEIDKKLKALKKGRPEKKAPKKEETDPFEEAFKQKVDKIITEKEFNLAKKHAEEGGGAAIPIKDSDYVNNPGAQAYYKLLLHVDNELNTIRAKYPDELKGKFDEDRRSSVLLERHFDELSKESQYFWNYLSEGIEQEPGEFTGTYYGKHPIDKGIHGSNVHLLQESLDAFERLESLQLTEAPKARDELKKEEVKTTLTDIMKNLQKKVVLEGGKKIQYKFIDDKSKDWRGMWDGKVITFNLAQADVTTAFHEIMHPFIKSLEDINPDLFNEIYSSIENSKEGKKVIAKVETKWGISKNDPRFKQEVVVETIALQSAAKIQETKNPFFEAIRKFFRWLKSVFFPKALHIDAYNIPSDITVDKLSDMLTDYSNTVLEAKAFEPTNVEGVYEKVRNLIYFQPSELTRENKADARVIFEDAWVSLTNVLKADNIHKVDPLNFRTSMLNAIESDLLRDWFNQWHSKRFKDHPDMMLRKKEATGSNEGIIINPGYIDSAVINYFNQEGVTEGLESIVDEGEESERDIGVSERIWMGKLNFYLKKDALDDLKLKARLSPSYQEFIEKHFFNATLRTYNGLTDSQKMHTLRFFNRINSYIKVNQEDGTFNERDNYVVLSEGDSRFGTEKFSVKLKGPNNIKTNNQNMGANKITLFEYNGGKGVISWISNKDYYNLKKTFNQVYQNYDESYSDVYKFFDVAQYTLLEQELAKRDLAIVFTRGESRKIGLTRIGSENRRKAKNIKEYVEEEVANKYIPNKKANKEAFKTASDIAVHEAMKKIWPKYLFDDKGAANNMKRIKLPFTPVTISKDMPEFNVKIFDYTKAQFINTVTGESIDAVQTVKGVGPKYINDGESLASWSLFKNLVKYAGIKPGSGSSKNVIYYKDGDKTLAIKHEMTRVPRNLEVWYNKGQAGEKLVAKIDGKGNMTDADGNAIDLLATKDEVKISDGYDMDVIHSRISGQSIGFISYRDKTPSVATHGTQWYSYVTDDAAISEWKNNVLNRMDRNLAEFWRYSVDTRNKDGKVVKSAADKLSNLLVSILETNDSEGYSPARVEHAKLGAGMHQSLEPTFNTLLWNKRMKKIVKSGYQPGSRLKIAGNIRGGNLNEGEIAISKGNASVVYKEYARVNDITVARARQVPIKQINEWLSENEINVMVTRYPVPHIGGVLIARIKRLHERQGLAEMHWNDIFIKLEADNDGDEIQIERLTPEHEKAIQSTLDKFEIKGINLNDYVPAGRDSIIFTDKMARYKLMSSLSAGETAIGEIANLMNVHGQLSRVLDHAIIDGVKITLRGLDEKVYWGPAKGEMSVREILRRYIQAALDNGEFMLLERWGYDLPKLYQSLFKREDGKKWAKIPLNDGTVIDFREKVYNALRPLIDIHKLPGRLRAGGEFVKDEGWVKFTLEDAIDRSRKFATYIMDREGYAISGHAEVEEQYGNAAPYFVGNLDSIVFKEGTVTSQIVVKSIPDIKVIEGDGDGISLMRKFNTDKHYGNPFSHKERSIATVKTENREESIERFDMWLRGEADQDIEPQRRAWILSQINKGKLDNVDLLYFQNTRDNHAKRLLYYIKEQRDVVVSPWEDMALAPSRTMDEHIFRNKKTGFSKTPFRLNTNLHENSHLDAAEIVSKDLSLIERAYNQDVKSGLTKGNKAEWIRSQINEANMYKTDMGNAWLKTLMDLKHIGAQTQDRNDTILKMQEDYDTKYKNLSKTAQVISTIKFLQGFIKLAGNVESGKNMKTSKVRVVTFFPASSKSSTEIQLLNESVMSKFYKEYNKLIQTPGETSLQSPNKLRNYPSNREIIRRMCE